jgi:TIR domain
MQPTESLEESGQDRPEMHDAFISYATEDNDLASRIAFGLIANGLSIWYAPLSLNVGDKLLGSIDKAMLVSRAGILILSKNYLSKSWTSYEMDALLRLRIEKGKTLLPIWVGVRKEDVEQRSAGLSGIVAITDTRPLKKVLLQLVSAISNNAPSRGIIPVYENPAHRFLNGLGEITLVTMGDRATTIFEFLIHAEDKDYPLWLAGKCYSKEELLFNVAQILGPDPDRVKRWVGKDGYQKLRKLCTENSLDPRNSY